MFRCRDSYRIIPIQLLYLGNNPHLNMEVQTKVYPADRKLFSVNIRCPLLCCGNCMSPTFLLTLLGTQHRTYMPNTVLDYHINEHNHAFATLPTDPSTYPLPSVRSYRLTCLALAQFCTHTYNIIYHINPIITALNM